MEWLGNPKYFVYIKRRAYELPKGWTERALWFFFLFFLLVERAEYLGGRWGVVSQFGGLWQETVLQMFCEVWEIRVDLASESADEKLV